jgi:hypothetical protein
MKKINSTAGGGVMKNARIVLVICTVALLASTILSGCQKAPYDIMDSYEDLQEALSAPEDSDIILPDIESLEALNLARTRFILHLSDNHRRNHTGYRISINQIPGLPHLRNWDVIGDKPGYEPFPGVEVEEPEPIVPNMEYADVPIEFISNERFAIASEINSDILDEGGQCVGVGYYFELIGCQYQIICIMDFPESDLSQKDEERDRAKDILYEITKNIIDKGMQQSDAADSEEK